MSRPDALAPDADLTLCTQHHAILALMRAVRLALEELDRLAVESHTDVGTDWVYWECKKALDFARVELDLKNGQENEPTT